MPYGYRMHFDSDGDNSAQAVKTSSGKLKTIHVINPNTAQAFLQLFDVAAGSVTVGATTPNQVYLIPPGDGTTSGAYSIDIDDGGIHFETAITYACTTTATGSGDPTTGLTVSMVYR